MGCATSFSKDWRILCCVEAARSDVGGCGGDPNDQAHPEETISWRDLGPASRVYRDPQELQGVTDEYAQPVQRNEGAIDSLIPPSVRLHVHVFALGGWRGYLVELYMSLILVAIGQQTLFQMTVSSKHGVLMSKLEEYATLSHAPQPLRLFFVVTEAVFPRFVDEQPYLAKGGHVQQRFSDNQKAVMQCSVSTSMRSLSISTARGERSRSTAPARRLGCVPARMNSLCEGNFCFVVSAFLLCLYLDELPPLRFGVDLSTIEVSIAICNGNASNQHRKRTQTAHKRMPSISCPKCTCPLEKHVPCRHVHLAPSLPPR